MKEEGKRYIHQASEISKLNDKLVNDKIFTEKGEVFKFGVSVALAINPDIKISDSLKESIKKVKGGRNIGQISTLDSLGELRAMIGALEKEPSENLDIRFEELGNWGLLQIKDQFLDDDGFIDWEKINKNIK